MLKSMLPALSESSEELFGLKCTLDMVERLKYYLPVAYTKPDSDRAPWLGARMLSSTPIEDKDGRLLVQDPSSIDLTEVVAPGCKVQIRFSISSLFFKVVYQLCKQCLPILRPERLNVQLQHTMLVTSQQHLHLTLQQCSLIVGQFTRGRCIISVTKATELIT